MSDVLRSHSELPDPYVGKTLDDRCPNPENKKPEHKRRIIENCDCKPCGEFVKRRLEEKRNAARPSSSPVPTEPEIQEGRVWTRRGVLGAAGAVLLASSLPLYNVLHETQAEKMANIIETLDHEFALLRERIESYFHEGSDEETKRTLLFPFVLWEKNKDFEFRNGPLILEQKGAGATIAFGSLRYFIVNFLKKGYTHHEGDSPEAGFQWASRTMWVHENFKASSLYELILIYHELVHVGQFAEWAMKAKNDHHFKKSFEERNHCSEGLLLDIEANAFMLTAEFINVLLDGQMLYEPFALSMSKSKLNAVFGPSDAGYDVILAYMQGYFPHRDVEAGKKSLNAFYLRSGISVYETDGDGFRLVRP